MNDTQENKNTMYLTVEEHLDDHATDYASHPKIAPALVTLSGLIVQISQADARAIVNTTGVAQDKEEERVDLEKICFKVSNAINSYGRNTRNRKLEQIGKYTMSDFETMRDSDLNTTASLLLNTASPIIAALADDRLVPADLIQLENERVEFLAMLADPRYAQIEKAVAGSEVDELMAQTDLLLKDIDGYVETYRFENASLWQEYFLARAIVDSGSGGGGAEVFSGTVNAMSTHKVAEITYDGPKAIKLEATGALALDFALSSSGVLTGAWIKVSPGTPVNTLLGSMAPNGTEILVQNNNGSPSSYKVTLG